MKYKIENKINKNKNRFSNYMTNKNGNLYVLVVFYYMDYGLWMNWIYGTPFLLFNFASDDKQFMSNVM